MTDETLFTDALAISDPAARAAFLVRACPDPDQRQRVEELLAAHFADSSFLASPAVTGGKSSFPHVLAATIGVARDMVASRGRVRLSSEHNGTGSFTTSWPKPEVSTPRPNHTFIR